MCFNPSPERRVPSPNRYMAVASFCFCKNNERTIIMAKAVWWTNGHRRFSKSVCARYGRSVPRANLWGLAVRHVYSGGKRSVSCADLWVTVYVTPGVSVFRAPTTWVILYCPSCIDGLLAARRPRIVAVFLAHRGPGDHR
jgi:hypothetical protein